MNPTENSFKNFKWGYLMIYSVLVLSDGFRGPFLWPIYKSYGLNDYEIYILYAVTFFSSAMFSSISGNLADRWSKSYTLALACIIDGISCMAIWINISLNVALRTIFRFRSSFMSGI